MSDPDVQLELKKRARRRLVGAVALALAAAIILPMVMESEPRPTGNELHIRIPSQEGANYASRLINGAPPPPPVAEVPHENVPEVTDAAPGKASSPVAALPVDVPSSPVVAPPGAAKAELSLPVPAKPEAKMPPPGVAPASEASRALAILENKPLPTEQRFYVQLGVYRDVSNVKSLQTRLKSAGFSSSTENLGDRTRVRVGPFSSRAAADQAVVKLKRAGMAGVVTAR